MYWLKGFVKFFEVELFFFLSVIVMLWLFIFLIIMFFRYWGGGDLGFFFLNVISWVIKEKKRSWVCLISVYYLFDV